MGKQQTTGKNQKPQSDTAKKIEASTNGRERKKKIAALLETRPLAERNADRSSDLSAFRAMQLGQYAFPGGNYPSVHIDLFNRNPSDGIPFLVAQVADVQDGHELQQHGLVDNGIGIFIPLTSLSKEGWMSNNDTPRIKTGQNIIHTYLWELVYGCKKTRLNDGNLPEEEAICFVRAEIGGYSFKAVDVEIYDFGGKQYIKIVKIGFGAMVAGKRLKDVAKPGLYIPHYFLMVDSPTYGKGVEEPQSAFTAFLKKELALQIKARCEELEAERKAIRETKQAERQAEIEMRKAELAERKIEIAKRETKRQAQKEQTEAERNAKLAEYGGDIAVIFDPALQDSEKCIKFFLGNGRKAFFEGQMDEGGKYGIVKLVDVDRGHELFGKFAGAYITMNMLQSPAYFGVKENPYNFKMVRLHYVLRLAHFGEEAVVVEEPKAEAKPTAVVPNRVPEDANTASTDMRAAILGTAGLYKAGTEGGFAYLRGDGKILRFEGADNAHELGVLQASHVLKFGTAVNLKELRSEKPSVIGVNLQNGQSVSALHYFIRKVGKSFGFKDKASDPKDVVVETPPSTTAPAPVVANKKPATSASKPVKKTDGSKLFGKRKSVKKPKLPKGTKRVTAEDAATTLAERFTVKGLKQSQQQLSV